MSSAIDRWVMAVAQQLGVNPNPADTRTILALTKDVAHNVDRPAAPVTAYMVGIAVGQGWPLPQAVKSIRDLADGWEGRSEES
jgi:Domain of unknown function (DUF6457)